MTELINAASSTAGSRAKDALCKDLAQALHAVSQPLTILRVSLGYLHPTPQSAEDIQHLLKQSAREVERLCLLFNYFQQFVSIESIKAEPQCENLSLLLAHVIDGIDLLFGKAGIGLTLETTELFTPFACIDSSRFEQALSSILLVAFGRAGRGDEVFVTGSSRESSVHITIRQIRTQENFMAAEARLSMALSASGLRSQGASLTWDEHPFSAEIIFPSSESPKVQV